MDAKIARGEKAARQGRRALQGSGKIITAVAFPRIFPQFDFAWMQNRPREKNSPPRKAGTTGKRENHCSGGFPQDFPAVWFCMDAKPNSLSIPVSS
jgi:hypothetical protein